MSQSLSRWAELSAGAAGAAGGARDEPGWRDLYDPARGARRVLLDPLGRAREIRLAGGGRLRLSRDAQGRLRSVEGSDGSFLTVDPPGIGGAGGRSLRLTDPAGETEAGVGEGGLVLRRRGASVSTLRFDHDKDGRLVRALLPGSDQPLVYRFQSDGSCEIGPDDGPSLLTATVGETGQSFRLPGGSGWDETVSPGRFRISASDLEVEIAIDPFGRTIARRWSDGLVETFGRDGDGRLASWARTRPGSDPDLREYIYENGELAAEHGPEGSITREIGAGGRVEALVRPDGSRVRYEYDAAGRRVAREAPEGATRYRYDLFGQLTAVESEAGARVEMAYDGLGRRIRFAASGADGGRARLEHRDSNGRLWSVTDEQGNALWTFLWWGDRLIARIDGSLDHPVAEAFLCDPSGTPLAVLTPDAGARRLEAPPWGRVDAPAAIPRPVLYGHVGDAETGLVPFGARDLDPELGVFLTPDPWHGGEDDPRRWAGWSPASLERLREAPEESVHPYALCRFDPLGRVDSDGHFAVGWFILHLILTPTWGQALTSISLFFFLPFNIYIEIILDVIYLIVSLFRWDLGRVPWRNYHIWKMIGAAGSGRQGIFAFGLNGILPRFASSYFDIDSNRAVTIGAAVWINREETNLLDRPKLLELWDIAGPPGAGGVPAGGATRFNNNPARDSTLAIEGTDKNGKKRILTTFWTRGFGNAVAVAGTDQVFQDRPNPPAAAAVLGTAHLAKPLPFDFPYPEKDDSRETLEVKEFLFTPGTDLEADAELVQESWFAFDVKKDGYAVNDVLEIAAPKASPAVAATFRIVIAVLKVKDRAAVVFDHALPARFVNAGLSEKLTLQKVADQPGTVPGWASAGAADKIELAAPAPPPGGGVPPGWPPSLAQKDVVKIKAAVPAGGPPAAPIAGAVAPRPDDTAYASVKTVTVTLQLDPPIGIAAPANLNGSDLFLLKPDGKWFRANVPDPAKPAEILLGASPPEVQVDDLLSIKLEAAPDKITTARVSIVTPIPEVLPVAAAPGVPGTPGTPATSQLTLDPPLAFPGLAANAKVLAQKYVDSNTSKDKGKITVHAADDVTVEVERTGLFGLGRLVRFDHGGHPWVRSVKAVKKVALELNDEVRGTPPFELTPAKVKGEVCPDKTERAKLARLIRWIPPAPGAPGAAPPRPSAFGQYPNKLLMIAFGADFGTPADRARQRRHRALTSEFFLRKDSAVRASCHPDFQLFWTPLTVDGDDYWLLETDLPIEVRKHKATHFRAWVYDPDDGHQGYLSTGLVPAPPAALPVLPLVIREFSASGVTRADGGGRRVRAYPPEVQVPVRPGIHDTHRRSLIEHELHHVVQNNFWGPLLAAIPLSGVISSVADVITAGGGTPDWLSEPPLDNDGNPPANFEDRITNNTELNWFQVFSIGGILQLAWKYAFLWPALIDDDARKEIHRRDFSFWNKIFNPFSAFVTSRIPEVDPNASDGERWGIAFAKLVERAFDLRSWTPIPLLLIIQGDGPQSFLEQGASRASGDLYSTILSARDRFNLKKKKKADLKPALGDATRLMIYAQFRGHRILQINGADAPGALAYGNEQAEDPAVTLQLGGAFLTPALFHPDLYAVNPPPAPADIVQIEGPPPAAPPGAPRPRVGFLRVAAAAGATITPRLRTLVPTPPRVNRSAGLYFIPVVPGPYDFEAAWPNVKPDIGTHQVTLTVESTVKLGQDDIPWEMPAVVGALPTGAPLERFVTEVSELKVPLHKIDRWFLDVDRTADVAAKDPLTDNSGWKLTMRTAVPAVIAAPPPGTAGGPQARVRLYRIYKKDDPSFDLDYEHEHDDYKVPSLKDIRSYLQDDLWIPVRDFLLEIKDLRNLPAAATPYDEAFDLDLEIPPTDVEIKKGAAVVAAANLPRKSDGRPAGFAHPRGQRWKLGPLATPPEDPEVYSVTVHFGPAGAGTRVSKPFQLTVNPVIKLVNAAAGQPFEAKKDHPLTLDAQGGGNLASIDHSPIPLGTEITLQGNQVKVVVTNPPAAARDVVITVTDNAGKRGRRKVKITV